MTVTINANSTLRRHCEAKEKITGEKKFICRSNLILRWIMRDCFVAMGVIKKWTLSKLLAMTFTEEIAFPKKSGQAVAMGVIKKINIIRASYNDD